MADRPATESPPPGGWKTPGDPSIDGTDFPAAQPREEPATDPGEPITRTGRETLADPYFAPPRSRYYDLLWGRILAIEAEAAAHATERPDPDLSRLLDAIETMDQKITPYGERDDGTILHYIVADSTWHRILAAARNPNWAATERPRTEPQPSRYDVARLLNDHRWSWVENTADDWKCECGWFGGSGWLGWSHHIEAEYARLSPPAATPTEGSTDE